MRMGHCLAEPPYKTGLPCGIGAPHGMGRFHRKRLNQAEGDAQADEEDGDREDTDRQEGCLPGAAETE